jgi:hypothetical protein
MEVTICNNFYMFAAHILFCIGPPKQKKKKTTPVTTKTSIVLAAPAQRMVFPDLPVVANLSKKRNNKSSSSTRAKKQKVLPMLHLH